MNTSFTRFIFFVIICTSFTSCWKKDQDEFSNINNLTWNPELALPLFSSTLTVKDSIPIVLPKLTLVDTASVELPKGSDQDVNTYVISAEFKAVTANTFPISGVIQIYFADSNNVYIDSLLSNSQRIVNAGSIANPNKNEMIIPVSKDKYNKLSKARKMYVILKLNASGVGGSFSQYSYTADVGIKAILNAQVKTK